MDIDQSVHKYLTGHATQEDKDELLDSLAHFYNDLLIWINDKRTQSFIERIEWSVNDGKTNK